LTLSYIFHNSVFKYSPMNKTNTFALCFGIVAAIVTVANGQISYNGGSYTQDFDSMGSSGTTTPSGWFVGTGNGLLNSGTAVAVSTGSSTGANNYNFGVAGTNPVTDRALGSLASSTGGQRDTELDITNNTGGSIGQFTLSYDGEEWRTGGSTQGPNILTLQLSTDGATWTSLGSAFDFTTPVNNAASGSALDGNASANRVAGIGGTFLLPSPIPNGSTFYLRWADPDDSGTDAAVAIDNFSFGVTAVPEPASVAMLALGGGLVISIQRIRRKDS
jgi:hypothetical protein